MQLKNNLNYSYYKTLMAIVASLGGVLLLLSFYIGKIEFFLFLNNDMGRVSDIFFQYYTYAGDGVLWIGWFIFVIVSKKYNLLPLLFSAIIFSTAITQFSKQVILPDEARPLLAISDQHLVHYVNGVTVHSINSFPSGHTVTAFTFCILIALLSKKKVWPIATFVAASLVGYSRIYLGQHFPLDIAAGMLVAVCTMLFSVLVQKWFDNRGNIEKVGG